MAGPTRHEHLLQVPTNTSKNPDRKRKKPEATQEAEERRARHHAARKTRRKHRHRSRTRTSDWTETIVRPADRNPVADSTPEIIVTTPEGVTLYLVDLNTYGRREDEQTRDESERAEEYITIPYTG